MPNLKQIKRRIGSVKSTQQITKAMKMVAAAKMRKATEAIQMARPYAISLQEVLGTTAGSVSDFSHPLLEQRPLKRVLYVVVTADRGLCGGFNSNVIRRTQQALRETPPGVEAVLFCVGRKGHDFFKRRPTPIVEKMTGLFNALDFSHATSIGESIRTLYTSGEVDQVVLIFNEFRSAVQQILHQDVLLPFSVSAAEGHGPHATGNILFEPDAATLLGRLLPMHVNRQLWRVLLDSYAAEQGARMTAMESATENAGEMLSQLTLQYNRSRQASITQEIAEIVGGAAAIS
ncbi:MAG: ATP synthase F1 subunit gamma [Calditrichaeota bacterium]|nr:ATP synthase F1 subunit gamma [Candidatus Cloacimonadota bacterium]MCB1048705.1 ATP synthase F1 subunit gamma [Calditrichota bacterium]MCB9473350.1 ATP synthase F1 subunit gamma [Candidatus Delongbacteria bacterium]